MEEFRRSLDDDPEFLDSHFGLARVFRTMGQYKDCITHLDRCLSNLPEDPEVVRESAEIKFLAGDIEKATTLYESLHMLDPQDEDVASLCIAISLVHEGPKKALRDVKKCLEANPNWVGGYLYLGNIHEIEGRLMEAEEAYQRALDLTPDHHGAQENIKRLRVGKPLESSPLSLTYDEIFLTECSRLKSDGYLNRAAELMEFWREKYPGHPTYCEMLVDLYREQGQIHLGLTLLEESPSNDTRLKRLEGFLTLDSGDAEKAVEILRPLHQEYRYDPLFLVHFAKGLLITDQIQEAQDVATEGLAINPEDPEMWFLMAKIQKRQGNLNECHEALVKTIKHNPLHLEANFALGIEHLQQGRDREAVTPLRAVVTSDPQKVEGWRHLAIALTRLKDYQGAVEPWSQVVKLAPRDSQASGNLAKIKRLIHQSSKSTD